MLDERGNVMIEFAICLLIFMLFVSGITMTSFWGIGNAYVREAAFEAARSYAVYEDAERAKEKAKEMVAKGGWLFLDPETLQVSVRREEDRSVAVVSASPRIKNVFGFFQLSRLSRKAECSLEHRFRNPEEYVGV